MRTPMGMDKMIPPRQRWWGQTGGEGLVESRLVQSAPIAPGAALACF